MKTESAMESSRTAIHRSKYSICVPYKDTDCYLAFSFAKSAFALLTKEQKEILDHPSEHSASELIPALLELGFLSDEDEYLALRERLKQENPRVPRKKLLSLDICPTMRCNFDCRYCFEAGRRHSGAMDAETLEATAEFVRKRIEETRASGLFVKWFGGEPTLELGIIERLSDRLIAIADTHGIPYEAYIQTNGYLLTQETAERLEKKGVRTIEVTIDGNRRSHDKLRVLEGGIGTYDRIMENLFSLRLNARLELRCNLHRDNLSAFDDLMHEVERMKQVTHASVVCTPRIIRMPQSLPEDGAFLRESVLTNEEFLRRFHSLYSRNSIEKPGLSELRYFRGIKPAPCRACDGTGFTIDELGNLYACSMEVGDPSCVIGHVKTYENDNSLGNAAHYAFFRNSLCPDRERCKGCAILPVCLGRCPRTWKEFYDCDWLKGNLAEAMINAYDCLKAASDHKNR